MAPKSAEEGAALARLRERVTASGWLDQSSEMLGAFGGLELCLMRFLRARQLDVDSAEESLSATLAFRRENSVGSAATAVAVRRDGVSDWWCGTFAGCTENGCVVTYWRFRCIEADQLKERFDETQLQRFYIAWMERGLALQREVRLSAAAARSASRCFPAALH